MKSIIFNQHQVNHALKNKEGMFRVVAGDSLFEKVEYRENGNRVSCPKKPKFEVGETIFVKEKFAEVEIGAGFGYSTKKQILYRADDDYVVDWSPAQHMKQEHSRLTLRIKSVKVERLQDISEEDAIKEGAEKNFYEYKDYSTIIRGNAKDSFKAIWNSTHKKPEEKWEANPFCFVYEYEVI